MSAQKRVCVRVRVCTHVCAFRWPNAALLSNAMLRALPCRARWPHTQHRRPPSLGPPQKGCKAGKARQEPAPEKVKVAFNPEGATKSAGAGASAEGWGQLPSSQQAG